MKNPLPHKEIEEALRAGRPPLRKVSHGFCERVLDALPDRIPAQSAALAGRKQRLWPRLVFAAACCLAVVLGWKQFEFAATPSSTTPHVIIASHSDDIPKEKLFANVTLRQVQELTAKIDQPLEKEFQRVLADTRNAIQFVASNFMPEN